MEHGNIFPARASVKINEKYGRWTVIGPWVKRAGTGAVVGCRCDCGRIGYPLAGHIRSGKSKSCGCLRSERNVRAFKKYFSTVEYKLKVVFAGIVSRCTNPATDCFHRYGGRGISICEEWMLDRTVFVAWAIENGYREGLEIDRIDNDGNYCPENCRWVTHRVNCQNRPAYQRTEKYANKPSL